MIGILEKETKELARASLLAFLAIAAIVGFGFFVPVRGMAVGGVLDHRFQSVFMIGSPTVALAFGVLQTLPEMRRGAWALLVHRPISRTSIFLGKAVAGVLVHLVVVGVPFAFGALCTSDITVRAVLPSALDIFAGGLYWFAGALIGVRSVRWHGSRLLPAFAAVLVHMFASVQSSAASAFAMVLVFAIVMGVAAWGVFLGERARAQTRIALVTALAAGATCAGICVLGLVSYVRVSPDPYYLNGDGRVVRQDLDARRNVEDGTDASLLPGVVLFDDLAHGELDHASFRSRLRFEEHPVADALVKAGEDVIASRESKRRHVVWTAKKLVVAEDAGLRIELPFDAGAYASIAVAPSHHGVVTVRFDPKPGDGDSVFVRYGTDGSEISRRPVPNVHVPSRAPKLEDGLFGIVVPPVVNLLTTDSRLRWGSPAAPSEGFRIFVILSALQMGAAGIINVLLARRHRLSLVGHLAGGAVGVVFGFAGVVAAVGVLDFTARVACPSCKKRRLVDRDDCEHCGAAFEKPRPDGTEIFAT